MTLMVSFHTEPEGYAHVAARESGTPRKGLLTLCGLPVEGLQEREPYPVGYQKQPGVPAEPFLAGRGCPVCADLLAV